MRANIVARRRWVPGAAALGLLAAMVLSACMPAAPAASIPFPGVPAVARYDGSECKRVLVIGDSMASQAADDLRAAYASTGRCAHVVNRAVSGSSVTDWGPGGRLDARPVLQSVQPDIVVVHLLGNEGPSGPAWSDPTWLDQTETAALAIVDAALAAGIHIYWALPPKSAWTCDWEQLSAQRFAAWETWTRDDLWTSRPVGQLDWRAPFGGETYSRWFAFPDGSVTALRAVDCVHFTAEGALVAAQATVAATQGEWQLAATPPVDETTTTTEPSTTTSTTEPSTTTSTTSPPQG